MRHAVLSPLVLLAGLAFASQAAAQVAPMPSTLEATVEAGQAASQTLTLQNTSGASVTFTLEVRPGGGERASIGAPRRAATAEGAHRYGTLPPPSGRRLTLAPQRQGARQGGSGRLFGVDAFSAELVELDPVTGALLNAFPAPTSVAGGPEGLAFDGEALYYLATFDAAAIFKLDPETGAVLGTSAPPQVTNFDALAHSGEALYALDYFEGLVYEIDFDGEAVVRSLSVPGASGGLSFGGSRGTLFVTLGFSNVAEIDPADGTVLNTFSTPYTLYGLGYSNALGLLFGSDVNDGRLRALDPDTGVEAYSFDSGFVSGVAADEAAGVPWLTVAPEVGTIPASASTSIEVTFDATSLFAGTYEAVIDVVVEDAVAASVPVIFTVTGEAEIVVTPEALDFGAIFVGGTAEQSVTVSNEGTAPLVISEISVSDPAFSVDAETLTLEPLESAPLTVTFAPTAVGTVAGTLTLTSDDGTVEVSLAGEGVLPPVVDVEPDAITAEAESGEAVTRSLTISNTGGSPLTFTVLPQNSAGRGAAGARTHTRGGLPLPSRPAETLPQGLRRAAPPLGFAQPARAPGGEAVVYGERPQGGGLPTLVTDPAGDGGMADIVAVRGLFSPEEFTVEFEFTAPINLADFLPFLIFDVDQDPTTGEDFSFILDAEIGVEFGIGVEQGGEGPEAFIIDYILGNQAFTPAVVEGNTVRFTFPGGLLTGLDDGANVVAFTFDFITGMVADAVPDTGFFTVSEAPPWLSVTPESGTVEVGGTAELTVTLDASELFAGTYEAVLFIVTNDPVTPTVTVPVAFAVTGEPELDVPTELDFGTVFAGFPASRVLTVENEGTDSLTVEVLSSDPALTTEPASFTVAPASVQAVAVTVTPGATGPFEFTLTLTTNDADEPTVDVAVTGTATEAPVVAVAPDALTFEVEVGATESAVLTIGNGGGSPLDFAISAQRAGLRAGPGGRSAGDGTWSRTRDRTGVFAGSAFEARGELPLLYEDAVGDAPFPPDLRAVRGLVTGTDLVLQLVVAGSVSDSEFGGFIGLDADEDPATGDPLPFGLPGQNLGAEFFVDLFNVEFGEVTVFDVINFIGAYPALVEGDAVTFAIPLADLADDGSLTLAGVLGDFNGPTDWFPESGAIAVGNVSFLTFSPEADTVLVGESTEVTVMVDAADLAVGTYEVDLVVSTNDPATPTVVVPVTVEVVLSEAGEEGITPIAYALHAPYPNPVRSQSAVAFDLPEAAAVRVELFDVQGRRVATLVQGERAAGRHTAMLEVAGLPSGVYLCRLQSGSFVATTKVLVLQ